MSRKRHKKVEQTLLDIVILVHGRFDLVEECYKHIIESDTPFKYNIVFVDNASPDKEEANKFYKSVDRDIASIKRLPTNIGFPAGNNAGARRRSSPLILFLNSDVFLDPQALDIMVRELDDPQVAVVGTRLLFPEDIGNLNAEIRPAGKLQHVGLACNIRGQVIHPMVGWDAEHPKVMKVDTAWAVTGASLMIRKKIFEKLGMFDEGYGAGTYEDADLCLKVREAGYNIKCNPLAWGWHYTGATAETYNQGFPLQANKFRFMEKWSDKLQWSEPLYL